MIIVDMDMPKNCMDCPIKCIKFYPNDDNKSCCPIKCKIEDIRADIIAEMRDRDGQDDDFSKGIRCGLRYTNGIIDKHLIGRSEK